MLSAQPSKSRLPFARTFLSGARSWAEDFWVTLSRILVAVIVLLLPFSLKPLVFDHSFVIGEFSVPDEFKAKAFPVKQ